MKIAILALGLVSMAFGCIESDNKIKGTDNEPYGGYQLGNQAALQENDDDELTGYDFATADIQPISGSEIEGTMSAAVSDQNSLRVRFELSGFQPSTTHGVHIHENASCAENGKAAGGHLNPYGKSHGDAGSGHLGDLGNITADQEGFLVTTLTVPAPEEERFESWEIIIDRALVIHAGSDDLMSDPSGESGDRVACGVIVATNFGVSH